MIELVLKQERALGNGTRPKGFVLACGADKDSLLPCEGVLESEIKTAQANNLCCHKCAVEPEQPESPPSSETSTRKPKR